MSIFHPAELLAVLLCLVGTAIQASTLPAANHSNDTAKIEGLLKRAEANLQSVQSSLSGKTTPPKGSAGKLIARRLQQAYGDLQPAQKLLTNLPANTENAAEVTARYNEAVALYQKLAAFMKGEPATKTESESQSNEVALGYPHADNFKNVQFTLKGKVQNSADQLAKLHAKLKSVPDQLSINLRTTATAVQTIKEARRQAKFVRDGLAKIPANGRGVAAAKDRLARALESLDASEKYFAPLHKKLTTASGPNQYPDFDLDRKRLQSLAADYATPSIFTSNRNRAVELYQQRAAAQAELERINEKYLRLIQQKTNMGKMIQGASRYVASSLKKFDAMIQQQRQSLPQSIRADMAEAKRMGEQAVANQTPLWFTEGIPQRIGWAQDKITLLKAIDQTVGQTLNDELATIRADLKRESGKLRASIIGENRLPEDNYAGSDRQAVIEVAQSGWSGQQPDAKILKIVIPARAWARETKWVHSNGTWYFSDRSKLQVRLIVADHENDQQAIDRPVTVIKDHQKGDRMIGVPLRDFSEPLEPGEYFLRKNV